MPTFSHTNKSKSLKIVHTSTKTKDACAPSFSVLNPIIFFFLIVAIRFVLNSVIYLVYQQLNKLSHKSGVPKYPHLYTPGVSTVVNSCSAWSYPCLHNRRARWNISFRWSVHLTHSLWAKSPTFSLEFVMIIFSMCTDNSFLTPFLVCLNKIYSHVL